MMDNMIQPIQIHNEQIYAHQLKSVVADASCPISGASMPHSYRRTGKDDPDYFPTPKWCVHALMQLETFVGQIWEPACGDGKMTEVLRKYTNVPIVASDLYDRGYGAEHNFLHTANDYHVDNIITNPPFAIAEQFTRQALHTAQHKVALLLRLAFLESITRYNLFTDPATRPTTVCVFSERPTFYPVGDYRETGGTTAYAWFVWNKQPSALTSSTELKWIPPGFKAKYGC